MVVRSWSELQHRRELTRCYLSMFWRYYNKTNKELQNRNEANTGRYETVQVIHHSVHVEHCVHDTCTLDVLSTAMSYTQRTSPQHKVLRSDAEAHATSRSTRRSGQGQRTDLRVSQRHPCSHQPNHHHHNQTTRPPDNHARVAQEPNCKYRTCL